MAVRLETLIRRGTRARQRRDFARDEKGATAIEFGLLALPFFAIVGAILETSVVFLSGQILESAVQDAGRLVRTGQAQGNGIGIDQFRGEVCNRLHGLFGDCSGLYINVDVLSDFKSANIKAPVDWTCEDPVCDWTDEGKFSPGGGTSVVLVQAYYQWSLILGVGGVGLSNLPNGGHLMGAVAAFRNEPF